MTQSPSETVDQARLRLAQRARESGVRLRLDPDGRWSASSVSHPGESHYVTGFSCDCLGFLRVQRCMHHSALLACLGWLDDDEPTDPDPIVMNISLAHVAGHSGRHAASAVLEATTTILIDGIAKIRIVGDTDELRVDWLEGGQPIDDLTDCTPRSRRHAQVVAYWLYAIDRRVEVATLGQMVGLACRDTLTDAA